MTDSGKRILLKGMRRLRISHIFALIMTVIMSVSMVLTFIIVYVLMRFGFSPTLGFLTSTPSIVLLSIVVGVVVSEYLSHRVLDPIFKIKDAAQKVAKGDFTVRLQEKSYVREIEEIARNFNIMVRELSNTETLRSDFVSNVSHEFKTPLAAIDGYATLLQKEDTSEEEKRRYIEYILENTGRLSKLTQNILALSKLENQEVVLQKERFRVDEQLRHIMLSYESIWEEKELTIEMNLEKITFYGNKGILAQVWSNLIDNAITYSRQHGTLSIYSRSEGPRVSITVKDTGVGMKQEVAEHAFDKFYQGERSHSMKGNGLGLALVKRIVELSEGTVSIQSEEGKGTAVTVTLTAESEPE